MHGLLTYSVLKYNYKMIKNTKGVHSMIKSNLAERQENLSYTEADAIRALETELEIGIESMMQGELYTIEEAWKEIDVI